MAVRREAVLLEVEDQFTREILKAAAATEVLERSLKSLSGSAVESARSVSKSEREVSGLGESSRKTGADIDKLSGRLSILARVFATLGPAIAPIGAVAAAGIAGLASQLGFATVGALSLMVAAQGVGDALKAVEKARLDPTVTNLQAAEEAMAKLAPEARAFVARFQELRPVLGELQRAAAAGWFPGLTAALDSLDSAAPRLERILLAVSTAGGNAIAAGADSLAGDRWADFFQFIEDEAPQAIADLSRAVGSLAHGFAELWMAFDPVNDGVRNWLVDVAHSFDDWAAGLDQTEGFAEFVAYINTNGPRVAEAASAIGSAIVEIAEAAAPLGGPVLDALTAVANAIAAIADSPLGTPILGMVSALSAASLAAKVLTGTLDRLTVSSGRAGTSLAGVGNKAGGLVALAAAATALGNALADATGAKLDLGDLPRDLESIANGKGSDTLKRLTEDLKISSFNQLQSGEWIREPLSGFGLFGNTPKDNAVDNINAVDEALASLVETGQQAQAQEIFEKILASVDKAGGSVDDAKSKFDSYATALDNVDKSTNAAGVSATRYAERQARVTAAMQAAREAAVKSASAFLDFSDAIAGENFSLDRWLTAFEKQVTALANWQQNIQTLRERGLNDFALNELVEQGPAAAQAVAALADAPAAAIERLNGATRRAGKELRQVGRDAANAVADVKDVDNSIARLAKRKASPVVDLRQDLFADKARGIEEDLRGITRKKARPVADLDKKRFDLDLDSLRADLGQVDRMDVMPKVSLTGVSAAEAELARLTRQRIASIRVAVATSKVRDVTNVNAEDEYAGGGYTGRGGKFDPAGIVHRGEVVIPQHLVRRDRSLLLSRYGHLSGMEHLADGGLAGSTSSSTRADARAARDSAAALKSLAREAKASTTALAKLRTRRDSLLSSRADLRSSVSDGLRSDLWSGDDWSNDDPFSVLRGDIASARAFRAGTNKLRDRGLRGAALAEILRGGDLSRVQQMAAMSRAQLAEYRRLFNQRARELGAAGGRAGDVAYGPALAAITRELRRLRAEVRHGSHRNSNEHNKDRQANRAGARAAARAQNRGEVR